MRISWKQREGWAWAAVAGWSVLIFFTIPFARAIQTYAAERGGARSLFLVSLAFSLFAFSILLIYALRRPKRRLVRQIMGLIAICGLSWVVLDRFLQTPNEAIHFFEYGVLSLLVFRAISYRFRDPTIYILSIYAVVLVATLDEILQWAFPGRYWDVRDIRLNVMAAALVQAFIHFVIMPSGIRWPASPRGVRLVCAGGSLLLLLAGLTFSNTPRKVDWYASRIPFLSFLVANESVMSEYGYRHNVPGVGTFYSRFTLDELHELDRIDGPTDGRTIQSFPGDYASFLQAYPSGTEPFLHEARVHLFRRDRYLGSAYKYRDDPDIFSDHLTIAYHENLILERFFTNTLTSAGAVWPDAIRKRVQRRGPETSYFSPVSDHLITDVSETGLWLLIIAGWVLLALVFRRWGRDNRAMNGQRAS